MIKRGCEAYQRGDQATCDRCGVTWDLNDDDPPQCDPIVLGGDDALNEIHRILNDGNNHTDTFEPSDYLKRLRKLSEDKRLIHSNVSFIRLLDYTEELERERYNKH